MPLFVLLKTGCVGGQQLRGRPGIVTVVVRTSFCPSLFNITYDYLDPYVSKSLHLKKWYQIRLFPNPFHHKLFFHHLICAQSLQASSSRPVATPARAEVAEEGLGLGNDELH